MLQATKPIRRKAKQTRAPKFVDPAGIETRFYGLILAGHCHHLVAILEQGMESGR